MTFLMKILQGDVNPSIPMICVADKEKMAVSMFSGKFKINKI